MIHALYFIRICGASGSAFSYSWVGLELSSCPLYLRLTKLLPQQDGPRFYEHNEHNEASFEGQVVAEFAVSNHWSTGRGGDYHWKNMIPIISALGSRRLDKSMYKLPWQSGTQK
jgi:hypothetical protein